MGKKIFHANKFLSSVFRFDLTLKAKKSLQLKLFNCNKCDWQRVGIAGRVKVKNKKFKASSEATTRLLVYMCVYMYLYVCVRLYMYAGIFRALWGEHKPTDICLFRGGSHSRLHLLPLVRMAHGTLARQEIPIGIMYIVFYQLLRLGNNFACNDSSQILIFLLENYLYI